MHGLQPSGAIGDSASRHAPVRENGRADLLSVAQAISHARQSVQLRGNPLQARAAGDQRTEGHQDQGQVQQSGGSEEG